MDNNELSENKLKNYNNEFNYDDSDKNSNI